MKKILFLLFSLLLLDFAYGEGSKQLNIVPRSNTDSLLRINIILVILNY